MNTLEVTLYISTIISGLTTLVNVREVAERRETSCDY